jgi:hypothetical protein
MSAMTSSNLSPGQNLALPAGAIIRDQYRIEAVLGKPGGFGITYLAHDRSLDCQVAIKEYVPRGLAGRGTDHVSIHPHSREEGELFRHGLTRFLDEARLLARLDHPNIVRVRSFFEANGTAYLVMDYYPGRTLARYLEKIGGRLDPDLSVEVILRVLDGLTVAHGQNLLHRDVKPENIYLTRDGRPILLDFGAARVAVAEASQKLTTILTPGYAPIEQYSSDRGRQGPWTDIYACAAVLYRSVTGMTPPEPFARLSNDTLQRPGQIVAGLSPHVDDAIVRGLAVQAEDRPQSVGEFQDLLEGRDAERAVRRGGGGGGAAPVPKVVNSAQAMAGAARGGRAAAVRSVVADERNGVVRTLWSGGYGLARSYWLFGVVGNGVLSLLMMVLTAFAAPLGPGASLTVLSSMVAIALGYAVLWSVGTWRAAGHYEGARFWAVLARICVVIGWIYAGATALMVVQELSLLL